MASHPQSERLLDTHEAMESSTTLHEDINAQHVKSLTADHPRVHGFRRWCYSLHVLLCILHLVLLAMLWHHPEHAFTIPFDNSILTTGLSAFLQAFYSIYTILLVFMTQYLALSTSLSQHQKLTTMHDISQAWSGLGAAILALWQQTKIAASPCAVILVFLYLTCISVLHVASSTIMQFQPYNASLNMVVASNSTWPDPSVNLSALTWAEITPLAPLMSNLGSSILSTSGLVNSTLYDTFARNQNVISASVNANTIRANCGLLPISSSNSTAAINAMLSAVGNITTDFLNPWKDEIVFLNGAQDSCTTNTSIDCPLFFMVTTAMELDSSIVQGSVSINTTWQYTPIDGGEVQTSNTTAYPVACSLYALNHQSTFDVQHDVLLSTMGNLDMSSQGWSLWSPTNNGTDSEVLNAGISAAMLASFFPSEFNQAPALFCQQNSCPAISTTDIYLMSLIGVNATANNITAALESSAHPSVILTSYQVEAIVSQLAAELIWLAGQLGKSNGGFALSPTSNYVIEKVPKWRLNINQVPVIFAISASFILLAVVHFIIRGFSRTQNASIEGVSVLGMLWIGAHVHNLRERFTIVEYPSSEMLRSTGMFDICLTNVKGSDSESGLKEDHDGDIEGSSSQRLPSLLKGTGIPDQRHRTRMRRPSRIRRVGFLAKVPPIPSLFVSCYVLHGFLVVFHLALMAVFAHHTEHQVIIPLDSTGITTVLSASLQLSYTLYTAVLVFVTQRLVSRRIMASRQNLTSIHDISRASTGLGSAVVCLWQQRKVSVSLWTTLCIMVYFACISTLHISSSTIMQFQTFDSTIVDMVRSTSAWPNSSVNLQDLNWVNIVPLVSIVNQFPDLSTEGLFASTVYDIPSVTPTSLNATVNATTVRASCGLLSNLSFDSTEFSLNATVSPLGTIIMGVPSMWNNTIAFVDPNTYGCLGCDGYLIFLVTTAVDFDADSLPSGSSVSVTVNETQNIINLANNSDSRIFPIVNYVVGCSLNETTVLDTLDLQNNTLSSSYSAQPDISAHSQSWTLWSPPSNVSELDKTISTVMASAPTANCPVSSSSEMQPCNTFTSLDFYIMENVGINVTESAISTGSSSAPVITLDRYHFENAVSGIAAQSIWLAGHMADGFQPAYGTSKVTDIIVQLQLNINIIPLAFALGASVTIFLLTFYLVGVTAPRSLAFSSLGALEILWLESRSQLLHDHMLEIGDPSLDNLRSGGVLKVCIADELAAAEEKDEQDDNEPMALEDE